MNPMLTTIPTLAVTAIYCFWHAYYRWQLQRHRVLRQRVTYLLWSAACAID